MNLATDGWQQLLYVDPKEPPTIKTFGPANARSMREWIDDQMARSKLHEKQYHAMHSFRPQQLEHWKQRRAKLDEIAVRRASLYKR